MSVTVSPTTSATSTGQKVAFGVGGGVVSLAGLFLALSGKFTGGFKVAGWFLTAVGAAVGAGVAFASEGTTSSARAAVQSNETREGGALASGDVQVVTPQETRGLDMVQFLQDCARQDFDSAESVSIQEPDLERREHSFAEIVPERSVEDSITRITKVFNRLGNLLRRRNEQEVITRKTVPDQIIAAVTKLGEFARDSEVLETQRARAIDALTGILTDQSVYPEVRLYAGRELIRSGEDSIVGGLINSSKDPSEDRWQVGGRFDIALTDIFQTDTDVGIRTLLDEIGHQNKYVNNHAVERLLAEVDPRRISSTLEIIARSTSFTFDQRLAAVDRLIESDQVGPLRNFLKNSRADTEISIVDNAVLRHAFVELLENGQIFEDQTLTSCLDHENVSLREYFRDRTINWFDGIENSFNDASEEVRGSIIRLFNSEELDQLGRNKLFHVISKVRDLNPDIVSTLERVVASEKDYLGNRLTAIERLSEAGKVDELKAYLLTIPDIEEINGNKIRQEIFASLLAHEQMDNETLQACFDHRDSQLQIQLKTVAFNYVANQDLPYTETYFGNEIVGGLASKNDKSVIRFLEQKFFENGNNYGMSIIENLGRTSSRQGQVLLSKIAGDENVDIWLRSRAAIKSTEMDNPDQALLALNTFLEYRNRIGEVDLRLVNEKLDNSDQSRLELNVVKQLKRQRDLESIAGGELIQKPYLTEEQQLEFFLTLASIENPQTETTEALADFINEGKDTLFPDAPEVIRSLPKTDSTVEIIISLFDKALAADDQLTIYEASHQLASRIPFSDISDIGNVLYDAAITSDSGIVVVKGIIDGLNSHSKKVLQKRTDILDLITDLREQDIVRGATSEVKGELATLEVKIAGSLNNRNYGKSIPRSQQGEILGQAGSVVEAATLEYISPIAGNNNYGEREVRENPKGGRGKAPENRHRKSQARQHLNFVKGQNGGQRARDIRNKH